MIQTFQALTVRIIEHVGYSTVQVSSKSVVGFSETSEKHIYGAGTQMASSRYSLNIVLCC
jgi:hypothetical protein